MHWSQKSVWPKSWKHDTVLLYDKHLEKYPGCRAWIRKFEVRLALKGGEGVKSLDQFPRVMNQIVKLTSGMASRKMTVVVAGGGSIGDFGGFVASVLKRGVNLVQVPTTWLAAIDSAHGGKTAMNVAGSKNQIGTFYPASDVYIFREFLMHQPMERALEACAEYLKMALLVGGPLFQAKWPKRLDPRDPSAHKELAQALWRNLPLAVKAKMQIVKRDPREQKGIRHLLNLGHTGGHVFEAELGWPHGLAVAYGLVFAATYSRYLKITPKPAFEKIIRHPLWSLYLPSPNYLEGLALPEAKVLQHLARDKKSDRAKSVRFIFLKGAGRPVIREVAIQAVADEFVRQRNLLRGLYA